MPDFFPMPLSAPPVVPPPIEAWIAYPASNVPQNHPMILNALSDDGWWNGFALNQWVDGGWWENKGDKIAEIIRGAVLDFREAYGAALEEDAKDDPTLVPTSCLAYIDATVQYNLCLRFDLYNLMADNVTRYQVKDYFEKAWKEASIYRRHIATMRKAYRDEVKANAAVTVEGTPFYLSGTTGKARSL
jgi:hypothetical protein